MHTEMVPLAASMYVVGPLIAFGVIAALGAVLRWAFDSDIARTQARILGEEDSRAVVEDGPRTSGEDGARTNARTLGQDDDYGLLTVAGVTESSDEAWTVQHMLADAGIRATTAPLPDGRVRILVFRTEVERARRVVGGSAL